MPSGLVRIAPAHPTATSCVPVQVTPRYSRVVPAACGVHVTPSGLVKIAFEPLTMPPTSTSCVPVQAASSKIAVVPDVRAVQVSPHPLAAASCPPSARAVRSPACTGSAPYASVIVTATV